MRRLQVTMIAAAALAVGFWLGGFVVLGGALLLGDECVDGAWSSSFDGARRVEGSWRAVPPGVRCVVTGEGGAVLAERVTPSAATWIVAGIVALIPSVAMGLVLLTRRPALR